MRLQEKVIVITGGAGGIGRAFLAALIEHNTLVSLDRNPQNVAALQQAFPTVLCRQADVTQPAQVAAALRRVGEEHGRIDVLINNAGIGRKISFAELPATELAQTLHEELATNYTAPLLLTKQALPLLQRSTNPLLVFVSSGLAHMPIADFFNYCASKAALHTTALSLRHQLQKLNIGVVEILPPTVDTAFNKDVQAPKMDPAVFVRRALKQVEAGHQTINIGQSRALAWFSRALPGLAFSLLNRAQH